MEKGALASVNKKKNRREKIRDARHANDRWEYIHTKTPMHFCACIYKRRSYIYIYRKNDVMVRPKWCVMIKER